MNDEQPVQLGQYEVFGLLGSGTFAKVRLATRKDTGKQYAVKVIKKVGLSQRAADRLNLEIAVTKGISHPNVIKMHEVIGTSSKFWLVMDYHANGELLKHMKSKLSDDQAFDYFIQIACALRYCHKFGICHRDLKFENVLMADDGHLVITDFGLGAISYNPDKTFYSQATFCGSTHYIAPEVSSGGRYDGRKSDIWSLGIMLYAMLIGKLPFPSDNYEILVESMLNRRYEPIPSFVNNQAKNLLEALLEPDPRTRPDWGEIFSYPWVASRITLVDEAGHPVDKFPSEITDTGVLCRVMRKKKVHMEIPLHPSKKSYSVLSDIHAALMQTSSAPSTAQPITDEGFTCPSCGSTVAPPKTADIANYSVKKAIILSNISISDAMILAAYGVRKITKKPVLVYPHEFRASSDSQLMEARVFGTQKLVILIGTNDAETYTAVSTVLTSLAADKAKLSTITLGRINDVSVVCEEAR